MKKVFWIALMVALLLPFGLKVKAETVQAKPFGQACLIVPTSSGQEYKFRWARLGADFTVSDAVSGKIEIDFSTNTLTLAYAQRNLGKGFALAYGKQLTPITWLYPGSRSTQLTQSPHMFDGSTIRAIGIQATWTGKGFIARAMQFGHNQWSATVSYHGVTGFWEENQLAGALFEIPWTTQLLHPSIGFGSKPHGLTTVTLQNFWQIMKSVRLYAQADIRNNQNSGLFGVSYEHAKLCFLRLFHEFSEGHESRFAAEATFAF